jgi:hypothetical protein
MQLLRQQLVSYGPCTTIVYSSGLDPGNSGRIRNYCFTSDSKAEIGIYFFMIGSVPTGTVPTTETEYGYKSKLTTVTGSRYVETDHFR